MASWSRTADRTLHAPPSRWRTSADDRLLMELRTRQQTSPGRARLRERVQVEHTLARVGRWQGDRARYLGQRKNLFDLRRLAVVHNLHVIGRGHTKPSKPPKSAT